jgi:hypothetical protein
MRDRSDEETDDPHHAPELLEGRDVERARGSDEMHVAFTITDRPLSWIARCA